MIGYPGSTGVNQQAGFTIIELLIATLIFSVILLIATFGVIQVSRTYIKGFVASETENTTRSIVDQVSQAVQLSQTGSLAIATPVTGWYAFCINGYRYTYQLNDELASGGHAFVRDYIGGGSCTPNINWTSSGTELLSTNERLVSFSIAQVPNSTDLYQVSLSILYGDDNVTMGSPPDRCLDNSSGGEFCALSSTTTTVEQRN